MKQNNKCKIVSVIYDKKLTELGYLTLSNPKFYGRLSNLSKTTAEKFFKSPKFENKINEFSFMEATDLRSAFEVLREKKMLQNPHCHYYIFTNEDGRGFKYKTKIVKR
jgi:hypothetical protein